MALSIGTNSGFVVTAPGTDPAGSTVQVDTLAYVTRDTSPATAGRITEVGWWCDTASEEANYEVGLYAADGSVVPGEAGTLLHVSRTNAKGTTSGWKSVSVNWSISPNTAYWIAVQLDDTATLTNTDVANTDGTGRDGRAGQTTLPDPFGGGAVAFASGMMAIYAVWDVAIAGSDPQSNLLLLGVG